MTIIDEYLNIKKYTLDKTRALRKNLLQKENEKFRERITHTKSVIDNRVLDNQFQKLQKISSYLRRVQPQGSMQVYLNRKESQIIRKYEKQKEKYFWRTKNRDDLSARIRNLNSSMDHCRNTFRISNKRFKLPFSIDKNILRKIAYV